MNELLRGASQISPIAVTIKEAKRITGLGHNTIYELMRAGRIEHTKVGRRTLVSYASLESLMGFTPVLTPVPDVDGRRRRRTVTDKR